VNLTLKEMQRAERLLCKREALEAENARLREALLFGVETIEHHIRLGDMSLEEREWLHSTRAALEGKAEK